MNLGHYGHGDQVLRDKNILFKLPNRWLYLILLIGIIGSIYYFYFRKERQPFRLSYFNIEGQGIDYLLRNKINPEWEESLGGRVYLLENEVLKYTKNLKKKYSNKYQEPNIQIVNEKVNEKNLKKICDKYNTEEEIKKRKKEGKNDYLICTEGFVAFEKEISRNDAVRLASYSKECSNYLKKVAIYKDYDTLINCERYANRDELNSFYTISSEEQEYYDFENHVIDMINEIAPKYLPEKMIPLSIFPICVSDGCAGDSEMCNDEDVVSGFMKQITLPIIKLQVVVIENTEDEPIEIDFVEYKELTNNSTLYLRDPTYNISLFDKSKSKVVSGEDFFAPTILKPNEKIVVPINIYLETVEKRKYVFGPSFKLFKIILGGKKYKIREEKSTMFGLYAFEEGVGSCPFVFADVKNLGNDTLFNNGEFMVGQRHKRFEKYDTSQISKISNKICIAELDKEVSFIDYIGILERNPFQEDKLYKSKNQFLKNIDSKYLVLQKSDSIFLQFEFLISHSASYYLISKGYYKPYKYIKKNNSSHL